MAWIELERWNRLTPQEKEKFPSISPDFVLELMSSSDSLKDIQDKMIEYLKNGVKLGWLINRQARQVEIYRQGQEKEVLVNPDFLSGEEVLQDFIFDLKIIW